MRLNIIKIFEEGYKQFKNDVIYNYVVKNLENIEKFDLKKCLSELKIVAIYIKPRIEHVKIMCETYQNYARIDNISIGLPYSANSFLGYKSYISKMSKYPRRIIIGVEKMLKLEDEHLKLPVVPVSFIIEYLFDRGNMSRLYVCNISNNVYSFCLRIGKDYYRLVIYPLFMRRIFKIEKKETITVGVVQEIDVNYDHYNAVQLAKSLIEIYYLLYYRRQLHKRILYLETGYTYEEAQKMLKGKTYSILEMIRILKKEKTAKK